MTPNLYRLKDYQFDIIKIQEEVETVVKKVGFSEDNQISLVYRYGFKDDCWFDGAGTSFTFDENRQPKLDSNGNIIRRFTEDEFQYINPGLENTELANVYYTLKQEYRLSRFRIARIAPKRCYGWHKDEEVRLHLAVRTSPGAFLITEDGVATHIPADGQPWMFHANNGYHTAVNADYKIHRLHLLINIW
jgi:hypothetical protein